MDGSDHKSNSSSSTSNKQRPSIPKGVDENGKSYQENDKPTKTNHFMSPTISATSKFNPSRKKVLAERNESLDDLQKTSNLDSKSVQKASSFDSNRNSSTEFGGDREQNSRPYDPLTNYLSPRPTFLRYKPSRRREILLRRETEEEEGENDAVAPNSELDSASSCGSLPQLEGSEIDESDDEFEEVEDERGWGLKGAVKVLMLLLTLMISTSYISSMNSPTASPVVQAVVGLRDGYHMMQNHVYEYVYQNFLLFDDGVMEDRRILDMKMGESSNELNEVEVEDEEAEGEGEVDKFVEGGEEEILELDGGKIADFSNSEVADTVEENDEEEEGEVDEFDEGEELSEDEEIVEEVDEWNETTELDGAKIKDFGNSEVLETVEVSVSDSEAEVVEIPVTSVTDEVEKEEREAAAAVQGSTKEGIFETEKVTIGNFTDVHKIGDQTGSDMIKGFMKHIGTESVLKALIGFSLMVLSSIILGLHFRKNRNGKENTPPPPPPHHHDVAEPCFESLIPDEEEKPIESTANFLIPKSLINSMEEASKATNERSDWSLSHQSRAAPTIELLGELEIAEMSTSLRSCGMKSSRVIESEVSSHSVSIMEKTTIGSEPRSSSCPVDVQTPAFLQISTFNYPSYSDEKKPMKKKESEEGKETEGKNVSTTPLRRSSRIRNRAISP